jgi:hypothetical protein
VSVLRPATAATDAHDCAAAARTRAAALHLVRSEDLEEALAVAAAAIGEVLAGEAVLRVRTTQHDLHAGASGVLPPSALSALARTVLASPADVDGDGDAAPSEAAAASADGSAPLQEAAGVLLESSGGHATCRVWVGVTKPPREGAPEHTVAELLLHCLAQSVDRIVTVDKVRQTEANLERAVESHRLVGQAMGILIERHRITSEEAFEVLRRASQDHNVKLREVARRVIETGAEPDEVV